MTNVTIGNLRNKMYPVNIMTRPGTYWALTFVTNWGGVRMWEGHPLKGHSAHEWATQIQQLVESGQA
jgi:hypothetical protein